MSYIPYLGGGAEGWFGGSELFDWFKEVSIPQARDATVLRIFPYFFVMLHILLP